MSTNNISPFKIESINLNNGHCIVRFINKYGVIYTGEKTLDDFKSIIEIPSGSFELDGTPIMKQVESINNNNPNEDYIWNIDIPVDENNNFISKDDLITHIAKQYPHDIFENDRRRKTATKDDSILDIIGNDYEITLITSEPEVFFEDPLTSLRNHRNMLLSQSDWTQLPDSNPPQGKDAWAEYRQVLRDLPENATDINSVVWPDTP